MAAFNQNFAKNHVQGCHLRSVFLPAKNHFKFSVSSHLFYVITLLLENFLFYKKNYANHALVAQRKKRNKN